MFYPQNDDAGEAVAIQVADRVKAYPNDPDHSEEGAVREVFDDHVVIVWDGGLSRKYTQENLDDMSIEKI